MEKYQDDDDTISINSDNQVPEFISTNLHPAIPKSARITNVADKAVINNIEEIKDLIPSKILLTWKGRYGRTLKIFQEILMTNSWNNSYSYYGLNSEWSMNMLDYSRPNGFQGVNNRLFAKMPINNYGSQPIKYTKMLYNSTNQLYFDEVFILIEEYLQSHGVNCKVKKYFSSSNKLGSVRVAEEVIASFGSSPFNKVKIKNFDVPNNTLYYYLQVSFDIVMQSNNKVYPIRGFTMLLSDGLVLYRT